MNIVKEGALVVLFPDYHIPETVPFEDSIISS